MKWIVIVSAALLTLAGCKSASKHDTSATPAAQKAAPVAAAAAASAGKISCTKGKDTRTLEVVKKDKGCGLNYTKYGKTSEIASSSHGTKHCQSSQDKVKSKLEKAGYKCGT